MLSNTPKTDAQPVPAAALVATVLPPRPGLVYTDGKVLMLRQVAYRLVPVVAVDFYPRPK